MGYGIFVAGDLHGLHLLLGHDVVHTFVLLDVFYPLLGVAAGVGDVYEVHSLFFQALLRTLHLFHAHAAGATPRGPEVNEDDASLVLFHDFRQPLVRLTFGQIWRSVLQKLAMVA